MPFSHKHTPTHLTPLSLEREILGGGVKRRQDREREEERLFLISKWERERASADWNFYQDFQCVCLYSFIHITYISTDEYWGKTCIHTLICVWVGHSLRFSPLSTLPKARQSQSNKNPYIREEKKKVKFEAFGSLILLYFCANKKTKVWKKCFFFLVSRPVILWLWG